MHVVSRLSLHEAPGRSQRDQVGMNLCPIQIWPGSSRSIYSPDLPHPRNAATQTPIYTQPSPHATVPTLRLESGRLLGQQLLRRRLLRHAPHDPRLLDPLPDPALDDDVLGNVLDLRRLLTDRRPLPRRPPLLPLLPLLPLPLPDHPPPRRAEPAGPALAGGSARRRPREALARADADDDLAQAGLGRERDGAGAVADDARAADVGVQRPGEALAGRALADARAERGQQPVGADAAQRAGVAGGEGGVHLRVQRLGERGALEEAERVAQRRAREEEARARLGFADAEFVVDEAGEVAALAGWRARVVRE